MEQNADGLVAPEGVYKLSASYVLPPQPTFMAPPTTLSALQPMSNHPTGPAPLANAANAQQQQASAAPGAASNAGQASVAGTSPSANGVSSSANGATPATNGLNGSGGEQHDPSQASAAGTTSLDPSEQQPKTALNHISMHALSSWAHAPIIPASKVSVASVRHGQPPTSTSAVTSLGRKDRQQPSHASTLAPSTQQSGSIEGSSGGNSDHGDDTLELASSSAGTVPPQQQSQPKRQEQQDRPNWGPVLEGALAAQGIDGTASHVTGGAGGLPGMAALQLLSPLANPGGPAGTAGVASGSGSAANAGLGGIGAAGSSNPKTLPKPKNNIRQTSSSFVQRLQAHPEFAKLLVARTDGLTIERHVIVSRARMLFWLGETATGWIKEPVARLTFSTPITAHDINQHTRSSTRLDIIIGFTSSDLIWLEGVSMRYTRINKAGCINQAPITTVRWIPGSETLVLTSHSDGTCTLFDVTREDSVAGSWKPVSGNTLAGSRSSLNHNLSDGQLQGEEDLEVLIQQGDGTASNADDPSASISRGLESIQTWDPHSGILVTRPEATSESGASEASRKTWSKLNPIAHWRVARAVSITDVAFSPDHQKLAIVSTDGSLRLLNLLTERLEGTYQSYYGAVKCVVWSPDARFLLTAGCDDLISIWTNDGRLLSRCIGHSSFVTALAFDPWKWRMEDRTYRFVSVGEDGKIFLWDFSSAALHRPRVQHHSSHSNRRLSHSSNRRPPSRDKSSSSQWPDQISRRGSSGVGGRAGSIHRSPAADDVEVGGGTNRDPIYRPAPPRGEVAELQPVASYQLGPISNTGDSSLVIPFTETDASAGAGTNPPSSSSANNGESTFSGLTSNALSVLAGTAHAANALTAGGANPTAAGMANAPSSGGTAVAGNGATGTVPLGYNPANEPGASNDWLVDVRCRPDGIMILHKSGAMRFLGRPATQMRLA